MVGPIGPIAMKKGGVRWAPLLDSAQGDSVRRLNASSSRPNLFAHERRRTRPAPSRMRLASGGGGRSVIPPGESECAGRRALLCTALDEYRLTPVQRAIAVRVVLGECNLVISRSRKISINTVKAHVHAIFVVAGVADRVEFGADVLRRVLRIAAGDWGSAGASELDA